MLLPGLAGGLHAEPSEPPALRVGTSGDYAPFSVRETSGEHAGLDVAVARAFAKAQGRRLELVPFRWPDLLTDLAAGRFDVAMSGVTVRPERSLAGTFSLPVLASGAVVLVPVERPLTSAAELDEPGVRLAVNAGGHLERVARAKFPRAQIEAVPDNARVLARLDGANAVDGVVTDTLEAPHWQTRRTGLRRIGPLTRDRKAYLWGPGRADQRRALDTWLLAREADGELARLRGAAGVPTAPVAATPLAALVAAIDERLALMPQVAEAKRQSADAAGPVVVRVPEREARVIAAAKRAAEDAARAAGLRPQDPAAVARLFEAQIAAARAIQQGVLSAPAPPRADGGAPPDLEQIRPALLRIGERIAWLLVRLPPGQDRDAVLDAVREGVDVPHLPATERDAIAEALVALAAGT